MVLEVLVSVSHFAATTPAIVVVCLGAGLFLVGILAVTSFFFRRKSTVVYRKSGVYLTNRSPIAEEIPLKSNQIIIRRKSDVTTCGARTPHLVMKKSPSPPLHYAASSSKSGSPITPPTEEIGGGGGCRKINRNAIAIHTNPICNTATYCEVHGSTKCTHSSATNMKSSNHLVKRENSRSPRTSPQISPSTSTPANLGSHETISLGPKNVNSNYTTDFIPESDADANPVDLMQSLTATTETGISPPSGVMGSRDITSLESMAGPSSSEKTGGGQNHLGILHFKIRYMDKKGTLVVTVVKCEGLSPLSPEKDQDTLDPYVKLQLLPEKQQRVKTRVLRHTRQPIYDEDFTFYGVQPNQLTEMTLHFVVLSFDRYSRDDVIGEVFYPMEGTDVSNTENSAIEVAVDIQPRNYKMQTQGRGEVLLSLCYQPTANRLTVVVLKARNLPKMDVSGLADPYAKLYLLYDGQRLMKKKTHVKKRTLNPVFNESFVFDLPPAATQSTNLDKVSLLVSVLDWDRVTKNEVIGRLELGSGASTPTSTHHWSEVLNCPRRQIADWHRLQP
ncbi:synaptotagmin-4 isoform X2 [Folsomia candida]|uniref:synaptotagmin-4 isoform X2 n=1 Tax=Folsomia candida TaxID=158441 RepID=UPI001604F8F8|nr:synaptotagmin-4 isoform X2 [Folsomia candida]